MPFISKVKLSALNGEIGALRKYNDDLVYQMNLDTRCITEMQDIIDQLEEIVKRARDSIREHHTETNLNIEVQLQKLQQESK